MKLAKSFSVLVTACLCSVSGAASAATVYANSIVDYGTSGGSQAGVDSVPVITGFDGGTLSSYTSTGPDPRLSTIDDNGIILAGFDGTLGSAWDGDYFVVGFNSAVNNISGTDLLFVDSDDSSTYNNKAAEVWVSTEAVFNLADFVYVDNIFGGTNSNSGAIEFGSITDPVYYAMIVTDGFPLVATSLDAIYQPEVAAIPIPAAVWLFGSGLLGLVAVGRRKRA